MSQCLCLFDSQAIQHRSIKHLHKNERNIFFPEANFSIYLHGNGRLGNVLFSYASVIGIANYNKRLTMFGPNLKVVQEVFPNAVLNITNITPKWTKITEVDVGIFDASLFDLPKNNIHIDGFLQSFKYFKHIERYLYEDVFSHFQKSLTQAVKHFKTNRIGLHSTSLKVVSVCVHVRRGDFLSKIMRRFGQIVPSADDISFVMDYADKIYKKNIFIIASNDMNWCKEHLNRTNSYFSTFISPKEDFALMASCDHIIMTVGTYGWMAGWITSMRGGSVFYYKNQWQNGSAIDKKFHKRDYIPPNWIPYTKSTIQQ